MKKFFLLIVLSVLIALSTFARDFKYEYEGQTLTYTVIDEEAKTCKTLEGSFASAGNKILGDLIIPSIAKDTDTEYTVIELGAHSFYDCDRITSVTIPSTITTIGQRSFSGCTGLTTVTIPNSVTSIGDWAFDWCTSLKSITIGNSVTVIGRYAFCDCGDLTTVIIPNSVTVIDDGAFFRCWRLATVAIPNFVTSIGASAFSYTSIKSVLIPPSVTSIGDGAFYKCDNMVKLAYPNNLNDPSEYGEGVAYNPEGVILEDGWIYGPNKLDIRFAPYNLEGEYIIPDMVTSIEKEAFRNCYGLTKVAIPNSVTSIGDGAFYKCDGLESVVIGNSVTEMEERVFKSCAKLAEINIYNLVPPTIKENTFDYYDATLHVVKGYAKDYKLALYWKNFINIIDDLEPHESAVDEIVVDIDYSAPVQVFNMQGVKVSVSVVGLPSGFYIVRQGHNAKKITVQ